MQLEDLLTYKSDTHSQNGEDGIIAAIFDKIGATTKVCCEFGAWDGIHLSNCRNLVQSGWSALMIEADATRFKDLVQTYANNPLVTCVNKFVDAQENSLGAILQANKIGELDFLSIDIDGLDYEIFETLDVRPRVICIEVNAGHNPESEARLSRDIAQNNVGQSLCVFTRIADGLGYDLVCYTGNAFFVRRDVIKASLLPVLSSRQAYQYFLHHLPQSAKEWLYLLNHAVVSPFHQYANLFLTRSALGISKPRAVWLESERRVIQSIRPVVQSLRKVARG